MSQPSSLFNGTAEDAFLSSSDQEQLSQADFEELFGPSTLDESVFSPSNSDVFDGNDFTFGDVSLVPVDSVSSSAVSTPGFSDYSFGQHSPAYPTPEPDKPHPYPFESQRAHEPSTPRQGSSYRPLHSRQQTTNVHRYSTPLPQPGLRRRSLSHSDVDRIAAASRLPNPTFVRLQAPRTRTSIPEELRKRELDSRCRGSSCQAPLPRGRSVEPTSVPYSLHASPLIYGMLPTPIGTPLNEEMEMEETNCNTNTLRQDHSMSGADLNFSSFPTGPILRQMSHPDELARSQQIIEIGALAVTNRSKIDPRLQPHEPISDREFVLRKLGDIEEHVKNAGGVEALRSCNTIRKVLIGKTEGQGETDVVDGLLNGDINASRNSTAESYPDVFGGRDDDEIMATLMKQHGGGDSMDG